MKVIIGKPNSGKSLLAEKLAVSYGKPLFYLATMKVMDEDGLKRVEKHRSQREGKGFITIEREYDIRKAVDVIRDIVSADTGSGGFQESDPLQTGAGKIRATVLLECVANLVGNELYDNPDRPWSGDPMKAGAEEFVRTITEDIKYLDDHVENLIIVSSEYESDGDADAGTWLYVNLLNKVNRRVIDSYS